MAIASTVRPNVLVYGVVEIIRDLNKKPENGGGLYAHEITVRQPNESRPKYTVHINRNVSLPSVGDFVAVECSIEESRTFGAQLSYERPGDHALDLIASTLSVAA